MLANLSAYLLSLKVGVEHNCKIFCISKVALDLVFFSNFTINLSPEKLNGHGMSNYMIVFSLWSWAQSNRWVRTMFSNRHYSSHVSCSIVCVCVPLLIKPGIWSLFIYIFSFIERSGEFQSSPSSAWLYDKISCIGSIRDSFLAFFFSLS